MSISKASQRQTSLKSSGDLSKQSLLRSVKTTRELTWAHAVQTTAEQMEQIPPQKKRLDLTATQELRLIDAIWEEQQKKIAQLIATETPTSQWEPYLLSVEEDVEGEMRETFDDEAHVEILAAIAGKRTTGL